MAYMQQHLEHSELCESVRTEGLAVLGQSGQWNRAKGMRPQCRHECVPIAAYRSGKGVLGVRRTLRGVL